MRADLGGLVIRSVEFDLVTKSEANQRFASRAGMFAKSHRTQKQRAAVRDVLAAHHTAPRLFVTATADPIPDDARAVTMAQVQASLGATKPNRIVVRLTRITPGELDDDNLRGALKAVRDAVAAWIGTNDRDPLIAWEYGQERAAQHVYRVRIELTDLAPGEPRRVVLAETGSEARAAKSRVKRLVTKAAKGATKVRIDRETRAYSPDKPTVHDLKATAERLGLRDGADGVTRRNGVLEKAGGGARAAAEAAFAKVTSKPATKPARADPDAEAMTAMRDLARSQRCAFAVDGTTCDAAPGQPCRVIHDPAAGARAFEYGVHGERAHAAGLPPYPSAAELNAGMRPVRVERARACNVCDDASGVDGVGLACIACRGTGKVGAWAWQPRDSKQPKRANGAAVSTKGSPDPGEERPARDMAPCTTCAVHIGERCDIGPGERVIYGVHVARAIAAGLHVPDDDRAHVRPARASTTGVRKLAPVAGPPVLQAWARLPWASPCEGCDGNGTDVDAEGVGRHFACSGPGRKLTREPRRDGADPPRGIRYKVPAEHVARLGPEVVLTRRPHVDASGEPCWLYA